MDRDIGFELLLDPEHRLYEALSVGRFPWWKMLMPKTWYLYLRAARGSRQGKITGHPLQAPRLAVLDGGAIVIQASVAFPSTDAAVGFQAIIVILLTLVGLWLARRSKDGVMFVVGLFVMTTALFGLRALH